MSETRGLKRYINLGGVDFAVTIKNPSGTELDAPPILTPVATADGGSVIYTDLVGSEHPIKARKHTFQFSFPLPMDADALAALDDILESEIVHNLTLWKMQTAVYQAAAGQTGFVLPRYRRHAPEVLGQYDGATDPEMFKAWLDTGSGYVAQTVAFFDGPTLSAPADGMINVARNPITSGENTGYTSMCTVALSAGDRLKIRYCPLFQVYEPSQRRRYESVAEGADLTLTER